MEVSYKSFECLLLNEKKSICGGLNILRDMEIKNDKAIIIYIFQIINLAKKNFSARLKKSIIILRIFE